MIWSLKRLNDCRQPLAWCATVGLCLASCLALGADGYSLSAAYNKYQRDYPFIEPVTLQQSPLVRHWAAQVYAVRESGNLLMDVFAPEAQGIRPGLVLVHGGGWQYGDRSLLAPLAQALAMRGYVAVSIDYRLSGVAPFPAPVQDVYAALSAVRMRAAEFGLDARQLALAGASAGGQLAALAGLAADDQTLNPGQVVAPSAIISLDGLWDFTDPAALPFENDPARGHTAASRFLSGRFEQQPARWRQASPLMHLHAKAPPILAITGDNPRFSAGIERLQQQAEFLQLKVQRERIAAPHSFWLFEPWFTPVVECIDGFLSQLLPAGQVRLQNNKE